MQEKKYISLIIIVVIVIIVILGLLIALKQEGNTIANNQQNQSGEILNNIEEIPSIEKYEYNQYQVQTIENHSMCNIYFNDYRYNAMYHPEEAYKLLNEEYRNKKFGSYEAYKAYIDEHIDEIYMSTLEYFSIFNRTDGTDYIIRDSNGKYYIFQEKVVMDYELVLDTYTIDLPEYTEDYNKASSEEKVLMNIQKFIDSINDKDYKYAYSKLDETFKNNNFKTLANFENYIKSNLFENNVINAENVENQNDVYLYNITITNGKEENKDSITKNFVMQLKEGTDFVMSFNI